MTPGMRRSAEHEGPYRVFLSHNRADCKLAKNIKGMLKRPGIVRPFVAHYTTKLPGQLPKSIVKEIRTSDLFLLLWTRNSRLSGWVSQEIGMALAHGRPILPVVVEPRLRLPESLRTVEPVIRFGRNKRDALAEVNSVVDREVSKIEAERRRAAAAKERRCLIARDQDGGDRFDYKFDRDVRLDQALRDQS